MRIKHFLAALAGIGLSLVSIGMNAQSSILVDVFDQADGVSNTHKIRFDYVICDPNNKIVKVETSEFIMNPKTKKQVYLTAPSGYHVDPIIHLQLRQKPDDKSGTKWFNTVLGTFTATDGRIALTVEGSSRKGYSLMVGSSTYPKFNNDNSDTSTWIDTQNANKGNTSLYGQKLQRDRAAKLAKERVEKARKAEAEKKAQEEAAAKKAAEEKAAAEAKAKAEKAAADAKAAAEKAAREKELSTDFYKITSTGSSASTYLNQIKVVVKDNTTWSSSSSKIKVRLDYVLCDSKTNKVKSVEKQIIEIPAGKGNVITRDFTAPSGTVIQNGKIHYEVQSSNTTHDTGTLRITNTKLNGTYALKLALKGNNKATLDNSLSSPFTMDNSITSGEQFSKLNTPEPEKPKVATELKINVKDLETAARVSHKVRLDYVICDQKTNAVKAVEYQEVNMEQGVAKTVSRLFTAPSGCYIREVHLEIKAGPNSKLTDAGIFKPEPGKDLNITLMMSGANKDITVKPAESSPYTVDRPFQTGVTFNKNNQPK